MPDGRAAPVVLLDLDGTLINTKRLYIECYRRAVAPRIRRDLSEAEILALRPRSEIRFLRQVVGEARLAACIRAFHEAYEALHPSHFRGIYPGIPEMLAGLRAAGATLGIVTGKSRRSWEITCRHAPLGDFDTLVFDDDVREAKPDPAGIRIALERLGAAPDGAFYLGDSISDVEAAAAAGVRPAAALWAKGDADRDSFARRAAAAGAEIFETPAAFAATVTGAS